MYTKGATPFLFDNRGNKYYSYGGALTMPGDSSPPAAVESSEWALLFKLPEDREPARLNFFYNFTESLENVSMKKGQIETYLQATPAPTTKGVSGFQFVFTIAGLLAMAYLVRKKWRNRDAHEFIWGWRGWGL